MLRSTALLPRIAAVLAVATLISACGSGSHHPQTSSTGSGQVSVNGVRMSLAQAQRSLVRFANCMHSHGVNGLPNPAADPRAFKNSFTTTTPAYISAMGTCQRLIPGQQTDNQGSAHSRKQVDAMLAFARCIRGHGFARFPDPTSTGELNHAMIAHAGIDLHQPAVVRAADACVGVTHGVITKAIVARFIAGH